MREEDVFELPIAFAFRSVSLVAMENYHFLFGTQNGSFYPEAMRFDVITGKWLELKLKCYL